MADLDREDVLIADPLAAPQSNARRSGPWAWLAAVGRWSAPLIFLAVGLTVTLWPPYTNSPPIRSDGLGYHAWTRAILDRNLDFCRFSTELDLVAAIPHTATGASTCANKYPPGLALLRFPVMAPFTAANHGKLRSPAEDFVNQLCSLAAGTVAVALMVAAARRLDVASWIANTSASFIAFGTGLFHFSTYDSSFSHAYLAMLVAYFCYVFCRWFRPRSSRVPHVAPPAAVVVASGIAAFFLVSIRLTSILILLPALAWLALRAMGRRSTRRETIVFTASILAGTFVAIVMQMAYNHHAFGMWTISSYQGEALTLSNHNQLRVLLSFQKGLFTWYPIVGVCFLAAVATRSWRGLGVLLAHTLPFTLLYGFWHAWNLSGGFGHRGFVDVAPVYGVVLAGCLSQAKPWILRGTILLGTASVILSLGLMVAYWEGVISFVGTTRSEWRTYAIGSKSFIPWLIRHISGTA